MRAHPHLPSTFLGFIDNDVVAIILSRRIWEDSPASRSFCETLLDAFRAAGSGVVEAALGVGAPVRGWQNIPQSFASARQSARLAFYRGCGGAIFPPGPGHREFEPDETALSRLRACLRDRDGEEAAAIIEEAARNARRCEPTDVDSVRDFFFQMSLIVDQADHGTSPSGARAALFWREICGQTRLAELAKFVASLLDPPVPGSHGQQSKRIMEIQRFIRHNYRDVNLTLQGIADHAGLSRTYLSSYFKNATGMNVSDYVMELRIEKAKDLLRSSRMKAQEIAASVGYQDANYFSALFKKKVGATPSDFRDAP